MGDVMQGIWDRALTDGIPLSVHLDRKSVV